LLSPEGQFGSRALGGRDSAHARYVFTKLSKITRFLFKKEDDNLMNYLIEEGQRIEPEWYLPIIPMCLVNGTEGIGTGWYSSIPCYNPLDLVEAIKRKLDDKPLEPIHPWFRYYTGRIVPYNGEYLVIGKYNIKMPNHLEILELPI